MASNDFLVAGGDGYSMFKGKKVVAEYGAMDEVLIDYMNTTGFGKAAITNRIKDIFFSKDIQAPGIAPEDITQAIFSCS